MTTSDQLEGALSYGMGRVPSYLGDGLYVRFDGYSIELFAHDGCKATNVVVLEPEVLGNFLRYVEELKK